MTENLWGEKIRNAAVTFLFSATLFLSAFLMFTVQPMAGKTLLPLFGGAPSVWLAAMAYFQIALLAGYFIAFVLSGISPRKQAAAVLLLLSLGFAAQPISISQELFSGQEGGWAVFTLLTLSLSFPFLAISSLSPTLQRLFSCRSADPYFLFAASNLGSFAGLLAYPLILEKRVGLLRQAVLWQDGFFCLLLLCAACLLFVGRGAKAQETTESDEAGEKPSLKEKGLWVFLAFIPSSLMMGITARVTNDTGAVPLFWILPLGIYLLTLVASFAEKDNLRTMKRLLPVQIAFSLLILTPSETGTTLPPLIKILMLLLTFGIAARVFHAYLAFTRPAPRHLTTYYLWLSLGGALGGVFNAFFAPWLFSASGEFVFVLFAGLFFLLFVQRKERPLFDRLSLVVTLATLAFFGIFAFFLDAFLGEKDVYLSLSLRALILLGVVLFSFRPSLVGLALFVAVFSLTPLETAKTVETRRNFFGTIRVREIVQDEKTIRLFMHGTTVHGAQQIAPEKDAKDPVYYGPLRDVFRAARAQNIGMIGLGAGAALCQAPAGARFTVYEIDPDVVEIASRSFDFIRLCGSPVLRIGDGRKELLADRQAAYDVLVIDAFSSDSIPFHLLTKEALQVYLSRLREDGILAFHISNRFYDLRPVLSSLAKDLGLAVLYKKDDQPREKAPLAVRSLWVVAARGEESLSFMKEKGWKDMPASTKRWTFWTDDRSSALSVLTIDFGE